MRYLAKFIVALISVGSLVQASHASEPGFGDPVNAVAAPPNAGGYPSRSADLDALPGFHNPPPGYGQVPFWWWTGDPLDENRLIWQLEQLHQKGISGVQVNYAHEDSPGWPTYPAQPPIFSQEWWRIWGRVAGNRYPIIEEAQFVDSAFPIYAIVAFWVLFTPLLIGVQLLLPNAPVLMGGYAAITWSMCLYEILHAIEHRPYDWWKHATEHPRFGPFWRKLYGFHHMHHANVSCNEAISGFFSLPIADWAFGTYHQPKDLLLEGRVATARDFAIPPPPRFVRWLDAWARKREARLHHGKH